MIRFTVEKLRDGRVRIAKIKSCLAKDALDAEFCAAGIHAYLGSEKNPTIHIRPGDNQGEMLGFYYSDTIQRTNEVVVGHVMEEGAIMTMEALTYRIKLLRKAGNRLRRFNLSHGADEVVETIKVTI